MPGPSRRSGLFSMRRSWPTGRACRPSIRCWPVRCARWRRPRHAPRRRSGRAAVGTQRCRPDDGRGSRSGAGARQAEIGAAAHRVLGRIDECGRPADRARPAEGAPAVRLDGERSSIAGRPDRRWCRCGAVGPARPLRRTCARRLTRSDRARSSDQAMIPEVDALPFEKAYVRSPGLAGGHRHVRVGVGCGRRWRSRSGRHRRRWRTRLLTRTSTRSQSSRPRKGARTTKPTFATPDSKTPIGTAASRRLGRIVADIAAKRDAPPDDPRATEPLGYDDTRPCANNLPSPAVLTP